MLRTKQYLNFSLGSQKYSLSYYFFFQIKLKCHYQNPVYVSWGFVRWDFFGLVFWRVLLQMSPSTALNLELS